MKKAIVVMMILAVITTSVFAQAAAETAEEEKLLPIGQVHPPLPLGDGLLGAGAAGIRQIRRRLPLGKTGLPPELSQSISHMHMVSPQLFPSIS